MSCCMIPPNCESIDITMIRGKLAVVVNFVTGFIVWVPNDEKVLFDEGVDCKEIERKRKRKKEKDKEKESGN